MKEFLKFIRFVNFFKLIRTRKLLVSKIVCSVIFYLLQFKYRSLLYYGTFYSLICLVYKNNCILIPHMSLKLFLPNYTISNTFITPRLLPAIITLLFLRQQTADTKSLLSLLLLLELLLRSGSAKLEL